VTDLAAPEVADATRDAADRFAGLVPRLKTTITGFSVRTKILGIVVTLTMVLGLGVTIQVRNVMTSVLMTELHNSGLAVVNDIVSRSADSVREGDPASAYRLLADTVDNHPDAAYAFIVGPTGEVFAHTLGADGVPDALLNRSGGEVEVGVTHSHVDSDSTSIHELEAPILGGELGVARVGLSEARLLGVVDGITSQMLVITLFVAAIGVAAASLLTWLLTRPILDLVDTTQQVGDGDLSARASYWADDEIGSLSVAFNQMLDDLEENRATIAETEAARTRLLDKLITAQEEERKRIARELHDTVGQSLSSLIVGIAVLDRLSGEEAELKSRELQRLGAETLTEVRDLSRELRPSALDDLGLTAALERYAEDFSIRYDGISADVQANLPDRLPPAVETALYRIVQEAMTNAARHGDGTNVSILLVQRPDTVRAIIDDNGSGFNPEAVRRNQTSVGVHAMQERAELLGGQLEIESGPDGTTVYVEVPR